MLPGVTELRRDPMQYLLMIYNNEAGMAAAPKETVSQMSAAYAAYSSAEATTVRVKGGKTEVLDGPYADTKEQLGGYYLIDVPDLDAALSWAARCPTASNGTIEVRAIWPMQ
jgi:hypothetical protein